MDELQVPDSNNLTFPTSDITAPEGPTQYVYESYAIKTPEEDLRDFKIKIWASTLNRCRKKLSKLQKASFPWYELWLGVSTMFGGVTLGSLTSVNLLPNSILGILFHLIFPLIAIGTFVAYLLLRHFKHRDSSEIAEEILDELPDPVKAK